MIASLLLLAEARLLQAQVRPRGAGTIQRRRNVWLVQNPLPCLPCQNEGCLRRIDSYSQCLDELPVSQVLAAVDEALAVRTQPVATGSSLRG